LKPQDPNPLPPLPPSGSCMETVSADVLTFSFQDLVEATEDFSSQYIIGNGGFGIVYKAYIRSHGPFAIKKIHKVCNLIMCVCGNHIASINLMYSLFA